MATNETSDTESADVKATSTATTATTAAASEVDQNAPVTGDSCNKKSKRLPSFAAIFKRMNERDASTKYRKNNETETGNNDNEDAATAAVTGGAGTGAANEQLSPDGVTTDGNDNQPKEDKQLVYAELVLKPAENNEPLPPKNSTEYAEIVYVKKDDKK